MTILIRLIVENGQNKEKEWTELFTQYKNEFPELGKQFETAIAMNYLKAGVKIFLCMKKGKVLQAVLHLVKH